MNGKDGEQCSCVLPPTAVCGEVGQLEFRLLNPSPRRGVVDIIKTCSLEM